ncbi:MAG TPA: histidinol dehydrogenase [Acetobacteraceae bacterium]|nr:histidinol dehydrogenase [Acetobacteraceae bacterium]
MTEPRMIDLRVADAIAPALLRRAESDLGRFLEGAQAIIARVRAEGDAALLDLARTIERVEAADFALAVSEAEFAAADATLDPAVGAALDVAIANIRRFHEAQKPEEMWLKEIRPGAFAGDRFRPIPSVACYVPRGKGSFPSVLMMTTIPAMVAGVARVIVLTPPGPDGRVDAATLVAARRVGVHAVYKTGGAAAVAAAALGTATIPRCDKIVGPGSPWVVAAKRLLADAIDTGTPAGPSECIVLADGSADGRLAALDLIIESEHGPDSSAYLVTDSLAVAQAAAAALPGHWSALGEQRRGFSQAVLCGPQGGIVLTRDFDAAIGFVNAYAPEHLEILAADPLAVLGRIDHAGEILLGSRTPVTLANFVLGPNAVLPTGGTARTASPLSVFDYLKRSSVGWITPAAYEELARHARVLARYEGFDGHAEAISERREAILRGPAS